MKREHMPFQYMGNFKAIAIDYEYYLSLSDKPQSVCLTERQMYILSAWNTYTYWFTRWYNTDDTSEAQIKLIAAELEDLLMCGCGVPVPSITDILNAQTYTTNTANSYITTYNTWNDGGQTVASIAPNLDYGTGDPANIDKMMCLGLNMLLIAIVEQAKAVKQGEIDDAKDLTKQLAAALGALGVAGGAATAAGGAAAAFVGFLGGPWLLLGLGLGAVGLTIAGIVMPADLSVFTDEEAFQDVYCTMVNNLVGAQPTRAAFQGALTPNGFAPGSLAAQLAAVVQPYLDDLDMYLQFLVQMNGLYEVSNFTLLPECDCSGVWEKTFDFTVSSVGWIVAPGVYIASTGYRNTGGGGFPYTVELRKAITWGLALLEEVEVEATSTVADPGSFRGIYFPDSTGAPQTGYTTDTGDYTMTFAPVNNARPPTLAAQVSNLPGVPGTNTIRKITLRGTGPEPVW